MAFRRPFTQLYCHLVWATWDRLPLITPEIEPRLHGAIRAKVLDLGCSLLAVGGVEDHVHCLCRFRPSIAVAYLVQQIKGASSHLMTHAVLGKDEFRWQGSYGAFTVGRKAVPAVRAYVLNQKRHHATGELREEWEETWIPADVEDDLLPEWEPGGRSGGWEPGG